MPASNLRVRESVSTTLSVRLNPSGIRLDGVPAGGVEPNVRVGRHTTPAVSVSSVESDSEHEARAQHATPSADIRIHSRSHSCTYSPRPSARRRIR